LLLTQLEKLKFSISEWAKREGKIVFLYPSLEFVLLPYSVKLELSTLREQLNSNPSLITCSLLNEGQGGILREGLLSEQGIQPGAILQQIE